MHCDEEFVCWYNLKIESLETSCVELWGISTTTYETSMGDQEGHNL